MKTYLLLFGTSLCLSLVLTPLVRVVCVRRGWLDVPRDERRVHARAVPRLGGVAVYLALLLALAVLLPLENAVTWALSEERRHLLTALAPASLVFLLGVYDDLRGVDARVKFLGQAAAGALFYALGGRIAALSIPLLGGVELPAPLSFAVTVFWLVLVTNAFNLIDGMDGLATGAALFAALVLILVSPAQTLVTVLALVLAGALTGFLRYNFPPAALFLGDSGSLLTGFLLAALAVLGAQKAATAVAVAIPLMAFGLPLADTGFAVLRRFLSQRPLFQGDREHIHHMLLRRGWSPARAVLALYGICALCGLWALLFARDAGVGGTTGLGLLIVAVGLVLGVERLRYHEVDEVRDTLKQRLSLSARRLRTAHNIRVRRASEALAQATTLGAVFHAVEELLNQSEFAGAVLKLGCGNAARNRRVLEREAELPGVALRHGCICWTWTRDGAGISEAAASRYWSLRLPLLTTQAGWGEIVFYRNNDGQALLLDINHLCTFFERELALAAERLLAAERQAEGRLQAIEAAPHLRLSEVGR